jgi:hypothetical protein
MTAAFTMTAVLVTVFLGSPADLPAHCADAHSGIQRHLTESHAHDFKTHLRKLDLESGDAAISVAIRHPKLGLRTVTVKTCKEAEAAAIAIVDFFLQESRRNDEDTSQSTQSTARRPSVPQEALRDVVSNESPNHDQKTKGANTETAEFAGAPKASMNLADSVPSNQSVTPDATTRITDRKLALLLAAKLGHGVAPLGNGTFSGTLGADLTIDRAGIGVALSSTPNDRVRAAHDAEIEFRYVFGQVRACVRHVWSRMAIMPCLETRLGMLRAKSRNISRPAMADRLMWGVGPQVGLSYELSSRIDAVVLASSGVYASRLTYDVEDAGEIASTNTFYVDAQLGLQFRWGL